ncbi:MAG: OpgC domain-containing protein [Alphaproteobacteria bacterium]|nr:OpgC domain-containing protein [Alphaproteobacteria bacterium]
MKTKTSISPAPRSRDIRLDFFRGLALFIIFVAHAKMNAWAAYTPGKFGFSDSAEIFVFCSGIASALAYGRLFDERGATMCSARIAQRCWQVYWAHIGVFFAVLAAMIGVDAWLGTGDAYLRGLDMHHAVSNDAARNLLGLMTLTYVPGLFDILPMYLVLLAMVPLVLLVSRFGKYAALAFIAVVWGIGNAKLIEIPAEPWSDRPWFFNPLAWQLVFFTGFAFARGWLPTPPVHKVAVVTAAILLVLMIPLAYDPVAVALPYGQSIRETLMPYFDKGNFGLLRYVHFLLLAYIAFALAGPAGEGLTRWQNTGWQLFVQAVSKVGSQTLPVFLSGVMLCTLAGVALNLSGNTAVATVLVNFAAFGLMIAVAYTAAWFKSSPWSAPRHAKARRETAGEAPQTRGDTDSPLAA